MNAVHFKRCDKKPAFFLHVASLNRPSYLRFCSCNFDYVITLYDVFTKKVCFIWIHVKCIEDAIESLLFILNIDANVFGKNIIVKNTVYRWELYVICKSPIILCMRLCVFTMFVRDMHHLPSSLPNLRAEILLATLI